MDTAPFVDRLALDRQRQRALQLRRADGEAVPALHRLAAEECAERLLEINRRFTAPAVVGVEPAPWDAALARAGAAPSIFAPDGETLALTPGAHDLIVHGLALHWANDPVGILIQMRRALRPDGLLLAPLFGGATLSELRAALATAEAEVTGGLAPRVAPMAEIRTLGSLLQRAGFALPVADTVRVVRRYPTPLHLMQDLRRMGEANALADRARRPLRRAVLGRAVELYAAAHSEPDGQVRATFEIVFLTGWAPAPDQPQPLTPGSAKMRLADALDPPEPTRDKDGD
ncbi:MAG: methyltransferase domain-containing protein [Pseudomonadota bacterium]